MNILLKALAKVNGCDCGHKHCPMGCPRECRCQTQWRDKLPGGLADGKTPSDFDTESLIKGQQVELEHTGNPRVALEIAMDHLVEDPCYYDKLEVMEKDMPCPPHSWDRSGERCEKCGTKDWMT